MIGYSENRSELTQKDGCRVIQVQIDVSDLDEQRQRLAIQECLTAASRAAFELHSLTDEEVKRKLIENSEAAVTRYIKTPERIEADYGTARET